MGISLGFLNYNHLTVPIINQGAGDIRIIVGGFSPLFVLIIETRIPVNRGTNCSL